jgi:hypothetical protein
MALSTDCLHFEILDLRQPAGALIEHGLSLVQRIGPENSVVAGNDPASAANRLLLNPRPHNSNQGDAS